MLVYQENPSFILKLYKMHALPNITYIVICTRSHTIVVFHVMYDVHSRAGHPASSCFNRLSECVGFNVPLDT